MRSAVYDLVERASWTFVQAFVGSLVATNVAAGAVNWREVLISAAVAGAVAVMKVLGVNAATVTTAVSAAESKSLADVAKVPAVEHVIAKDEAVPAVEKAVKAVQAAPVVQAAEHTPVKDLAATVASLPAVADAVKAVGSNPTVETTEQVAREIAKRLLAGK